ncbi:hypothetical protein HK102_002573 [Quaeritorhiza haematococci]|nr:hypothetical protein HK102_002573 [Quaeritorhiza haematococci]
MSAHFSKPFTEIWIPDCLMQRPPSFKDVDAEFKLRGSTTTPPDNIEVTLPYPTTPHNPYHDGKRLPVTYDPFHKGMIVDKRAFYPYASSAMLMGHLRNMDISRDPKYQAKLTKDFSQ